MPNFTDVTGLASVASAIAASVLLLPRVTRLGMHRLAMLQGALLLVALIPFNGLPIAAYVRGATGDLSITTMALLWCALLRPLLTASAVCGAPESRDRLALMGLIALAAIALYPMALGFGSLDPYRVGYGKWLSVAALLPIALAAWFRRYYLVALCIALAVLAWAAGWYESDNLWDYLLDPFVAIYALGAITMHAFRILVKPQRSSAQ
jgi:hypothetical protein